MSVPRPKEVSKLSSVLLLNFAVIIQNYIAYQVERVILIVSSILESRHNFYYNLKI